VGGVMVEMLLANGAELVAAVIEGHFFARFRCHAVLLPLKTRRHHVSQIINRKTVYN
jgi:hypothetical protein